MSYDTPSKNRKPPHGAFRCNTKSTGQAEELGKTPACMCSGMFSLTDAECFSCFGLLLFV